MKKLKILFSLLLMLSANILFAQSASTIDTDKKQLIETIEKWNQAMLDGNKDVIKDFYPNNGKTLFVSYQNIQEISNDMLVKSFTSQFESIKYTKYNTLPDPKIYITEDGHTAFVYSTMEVAYEALSSNKGESFSIIGLEVFVKENNKWVSVLRTTEEVKEKRKPITLDKNILDDYNGTYKSERTGNIFSIKNDGKNLISTLGDEESIYIPQSQYSFYKDRFAQNIVFGRDKTGKVRFYTYMKDNVCTVMNKID